MELKLCNFLSTLFWNKDFISQESAILADVEKIIKKTLWHEQKFHTIQFILNFRPDND